MSLNPHAREFVPKAAPFFIPLVPPHPTTPMMHFRYDELQKMYNESQRELAALKKTNANLGQAHADLKESEDSLRMEVEFLQNKVMDLENKNISLYHGMCVSMKKQTALEQEHASYMKVRETSVASIYRLEASVANLEKENRALQELATLQKNELDSKVADYEEKIADLQNRLSDAILRFIEKFGETEKARSEAVYNMELAIHQKKLKAEELIKERAQWAEERSMLQVTLNSLSANYEEKNGEVAYYKEIFQNYERRILELQAYKGIVGHLYTPPSKPTRRIMNPETDYDSDPEEAT